MPGPDGAKEPQYVNSHMSSSLVLHTRGAFLLFCLVIIFPINKVDGQISLFHYVERKKSGIETQNLCIHFFPHIYAGIYKRRTCSLIVCASHILQTRQTHIFQEMALGEILRWTRNIR